MLAERTFSGAHLKERIIIKKKFFKHKNREVNIFVNEKRKCTSFFVLFQHGSLHFRGEFSGHTVL